MRHRRDPTASTDATWIPSVLDGMAGPSGAPRPRRLGPGSVRGQSGWPTAGCPSSTSTGSPQPMASADGRYHIVFNGEILNYRALRAELDYPFRTDGDTEVLLALFIEGGLAALGRARGQFAFAIHDGSPERHLAVRDRLGDPSALLPSRRLHLVFGVGGQGSAGPPATAVRAARRGRAGRLPASARRAGSRTLFSGREEGPARSACCVVGRRRDLHGGYWDLPPIRAMSSTSDARCQRSTRSTRALVDAVGRGLGGRRPGRLLPQRWCRQQPHRRSGEPSRTPPAHLLRPASATHGSTSGDHARAVSQHSGPSTTRCRSAPRTSRPCGLDHLASRRTMSEPADIAVFRLAQEARCGQGRAVRRRQRRALRGLPEVPLRDRPPCRRGRFLRFRRVVLGPWSAACRTRAPPEDCARAMEGRDTSDRMTTWFAPFPPGVIRLLGTRPLIRRLRRPA